MLTSTPELHAANPYQENFDSGTATGWATFNGDWNVVNQYYANEVTSGKTLAFFQNDTWTTGFTYKADLHLDWYQSGNNAGLIFGYQNDQNFYEVLFNVRGPEEASGSVTINRVNAGTTELVATDTIEVLPPDAWFTAQVTLNGSSVTIRVNDVVVATGILPVAPIAGRIGVISRNNRCRFDNLSVVLGGGVLKFISGFEPSVTINIPTGGGPPTIIGTDSSAPAGKNNWNNLTTYFPWVYIARGFLEAGSLSIENDPAGGTSKVLRLRNVKNGTVAWSRSEWRMEEGLWTEDPSVPGLFNRQFYRVRMYIPAAIKNAVATTAQAPWYMIWESHAWEQYDNTRHGIYLRKDANSSLWYFEVVQQKDPPSTPWTYENTQYQNIAVPFNQWFTLDVYFRYHETSGRFYVAITKQGQARQVIADHIGPTKFGAKLHDQTLFKLYHSSDYFDDVASPLTATNQYYDDLEIWSEFPPNYVP